MSSFMCDNDHLTVVAAAYVRLVMNPSENRATFLQQVATIGEALHTTNSEAMLARYNEPADSQFPFEVVEKVLGKHYAALDVISAAHCYRYQACEASEWETSEAHKFTTDLIVALTRKLGGHSWGMPSALRMPTETAIEI